MKEDTQVDSIFFTIDTARSYRFVFSYLSMLELTIFGIVFLFPIVLFGIASIAMIIIILLLNLLLLVVNLVLFFFKSSIGFIDFQTIDIVINSPIWDTLLEAFISDGFIYLILVFFIVAIPIITGYAIGSYVESSKTALISSVVWSIFILSIFYMIEPWNFLTLIPSQLFQILLFLRVFIYIIPIFKVSRSKQASEDYTLIDVKGIYKYSFFTTGGTTILLLITTLSFLFSSNIKSIINDETNTPTSEVIRIVSYTLILTTLLIIFVFYVHGDHPMDIRIDGIELREDLLAQAKEFRELTPDNIDEFVHKSSTRMI